MFEHADRNDAVEGFTDVAIVLQPEFNPIGQPRVIGAIPRHRELLLGKGDAGDFGSGDACEIERHAAKPAADVERRRAILRQELGGDVTLLRRLGVVERLAGVFEIGAAVLAVRIEEEIVEARVEVIVAGDVAPRAPPVIALVEAAKGDASSHAAPAPTAVPAVRRDSARRDPVGCKGRRE